MTKCFHCGAETSNGLALCELCQRKALTIFEFLPVYFRNLARWRPGRAGSRQVPGSRVLYDGTVRGIGTGDRISDTLDEITNALTTWARALVNDRPHFPRPLTFADAALTGDLPPEVADSLTDDPGRLVTGLCTGFKDHLTSISTLDWCGEFVRDLDDHESRLRRFTEVFVPGWYAGGCSHCDSGTYVVPGLTWITCGSCGATTHASDHLETVLIEARGWVARPLHIAEAVVALVDTELSVPKLHARIRKWAQQGLITSLRRTERGYSWDEELERYVVTDQYVGYPRYRLGEVLDIVFTNTRASDKARAS